VSGHTETLMMETELFSETMVDLNNLTWLPAQEKGFTEFFLPRNLQDKQVCCCLCKWNIQKKQIGLVN